MKNIKWSSLSINQLTQQLDTDPEKGLTSDESASRLSEYGPNVITEGKRRSLGAIFFKQFQDVMILVLLAAALISGLIGDTIDTIVIIVIVALNAIIGAAQEFRAERAMASLKMMAAPTAQVKRQGVIDEIPAEGLVPGDVVLLQAGDVVAADMRLIENADLSMNESLLTGESTPVLKNTDVPDSDAISLSDCHNMVFKGSQVTVGRGLGLVVATGMDTELGHIATLLQKTPVNQTPLQQRLTLFGKRLALVVLAICSLIFIFGWLRGEPIMIMLLTAISLAVAAIPEALPAVVSIALAMGAWRLSKQQALLRNLPAVETLGSVTYICADKTGTLTQNRMTVEHYFIGEELTDTIPAGNDHLGQAMALNNDVEQREDEVLGEPTETALYMAAIQQGFDKQSLLEQMPRIAEIPFDSERKRMTTVHGTEQAAIVFCKGAPESVLPLCPRIDVEALLKQADSMASEGYRVLAFACREISSSPSNIEETDLEQDLQLLGLVALIDPPREEAAQAVEDCINAGITPVMITGDHPATAMAIARRLGIADSDAELVTGAQMNEMGLPELTRRAEEIRVYARVSPEQKIHIVEALRKNGEFCAMTGDGVNDAPALQQADIGIAMGEKGTDVAREASDMILLDDNFATIARAVREGRHIFDNIRKFIKYTMTSNSGEIWVLFLAPFLGLPIPLLPIHILWINLVTDGLPGLALTAEPAEQDIMQRPPRPPEESIFAGGMWQHMLWIGLLIGIISLGAQAWAIGSDSSHWQTMVFTVLTFSQLAHVMVVRSNTQMLWQIGLFSNRPLLAAVLFTVMLQLCIIYIPFLNNIFKTDPLNATELFICFCLPMIVIAVVEIEKFIRLKRKSARLHSTSNA